MAKIDWDEYKEYKKHAVKENKLAIVVDFLKSYYNMSNPRDIYEMLAGDGIGEMLLERNEIENVESLESFMFKS